MSVLGRLSAAHGHVLIVCPYHLHRYIAAIWIDAQSAFRMRGSKKLRAGALAFLSAPTSSLTHHLCCLFSAHVLERSQEARLLIDLIRLSVKRSLQRLPKGIRENFD